MSISERRQGPDRRIRPRGGRRPEDGTGFTPLVLVVDEDSRGRELCEAILAKLSFAVTPAISREKALQIMAALRPDVIVARSADARALRERTAKGLDGPAVPVVELGEGGPDPIGLIEEIRAALRTGRVARG